MPSDPDHVLDAIDGVVDEWLAMSEDSMRWAPPEKPPPKPRLALPSPPLPHLVEELLQEVGVHTQAVVEAFRPLGEGVMGAFASFFDSPAMRQLIEPADWPEEHPPLDVDIDYDVPDPGPAPGSRPPPEADRPG
ncbi:hypothetical protein [Streptosporangium carneum]|uniref:Uncharacterized protein n=1 Tax=Streptosporangium carneum TaxID=47481 RepID=A0A9W6MF41_9ACTN|nr:hypothetical protein [Streptosporangium carneum]GLK12249.1 hypothetical protein GCM10017600_56580 [Streptosporangium carneum]